MSRGVFRTYGLGLVAYEKYPGLSKYFGCIFCYRGGTAYQDPSYVSRLLQDLQGIFCRDISFVAGNIAGTYESFKGYLIDRLAVS